MSREQLIGIAPKVPKTLTFTPDRKSVAQSALDRPGVDAAVPGIDRRGCMVEAARLIWR